MIYLLICLFSETFLREFKIRWNRKFSIITVIIVTIIINIVNIISCFTSYLNILSVYFINFSIAWLRIMSGANRDWLDWLTDCVIGYIFNRGRCNNGFYSGLKSLIAVASTEGELRQTATVLRRWDFTFTKGGYS